MKPPPFGKPLKALLENAQLPTNSVYIYIGNKAWEKGKNSSVMRPNRTLILPPDESPLAYDWPVNGCDILMIETSKLDKYYIEWIVDTLFAYAANRIVLISVEMLSTIYKKDP